MPTEKNVVIFSTSDDIEKHFGDQKIDRIKNIQDFSEKKMKRADLFVIDVRNGEKIHLVNLLQLTYANQWCPVLIYEPDSEDKNLSIENKTLHFAREKDGKRKIHRKVSRLLNGDGTPPTLKDLTTLLFLNRIRKNNA